MLVSSILVQSFSDGADSQHRRRSSTRWPRRRALPAEARVPPSPTGHIGERDSYKARVVRRGSLQRHRRKHPPRPLVSPVSEPQLMRPISGFVFAARAIFAAPSQRSRRRAIAPAALRRAGAVANKAPGMKARSCNEMLLGRALLIFLPDAFRRALISGN